MALEPAKTVFADVEEFLSEFSQSVTYNDVAAGAGEESPPTVTPVTITSVSASHTDPGIKIEFSGNNVTISGKYTTVFPNKSFAYIPYKNPPTPVQGVAYADIPAKIDTLVSYTPDKTVETTVTYTVNTSGGSATIEQKVTNNWDAGKAQMLEAQSRGEY